MEDHKIQLIQTAITLRKKLQLVYKKTDEIFKIVIKPFKFKIWSDQSIVGVIGGYLEHGNYIKRLFFLQQIIALEIVQN